MTLEQREVCAELLRRIRTRTLEAARVLACRDLTDDMTAEQLRGRLRALCLVLKREQKATAAFAAYLVGPEDTPEAGAAAIALLRFMDLHLLAFDEDTRWDDQAGQAGQE
jgi:hypothetical protein